MSSRHCQVTGRSPARLRNRDTVAGRSRAVFHAFGLSRMCSARTVEYIGPSPE